MADQPDFDKMSPEEIAEYQRANCIFCKIIKGEIPSRKVYEDDKIICIMDIRPAYKGHVLMMTKEHYPFLPVIPPETSGHMFRITKEIAKALKSAIVTDKVTVFIANGGLAGQQSPHFLYHIIPRENGDKLDNFNIPSKEIAPEEIEKVKPLLTQRLAAITAQILKKTPPKPVLHSPPRQESQAAGLQGSSSQPASSQPSAPNIQDLAKMILDNPQLKDMILNEPERFKATLEANPDLKKLFVGVDIDKLSMALKQASGAGK
ncbi:HIT domain-containing protein [Candidatus Woesearchaeota archaeon]|nr:HIT domain-containing protein [Candidatus Woesearchaeota archaeon]